MTEQLKEALINSLSNFLFFSTEKTGNPSKVWFLMVRGYPRFGKKTNFFPLFYKSWTGRGPFQCPERKFVIFQKYLEVIFLLRASSFEESVTFGLVK